MDELERILGAAGSATCERRDFWSADVLDHLDELVDGISLPASELDELTNLLHDRSALGRSSHGNPATASKLEQPLVL